MKKKILFLLSVLFAIIIYSNLIFASSGHMKLLTVSENSNNDSVEGGLADLYLQIVPGEGRVFLDSFPLSKSDTQSSTRYANKIACEFADKNCENYDFLYTIRADAALIGGPSAGAAIAILTSSLLLGDDIRGDALITGTINSGGIIGPVGGVYQKGSAAQRHGYDYLLISGLTTNETQKIMDVSNALNTSINISLIENKTDSLDSLKLNVKKVFTLEEAYDFMTHKKYEEHYEKIIPNDDYLKIMTDIQEELCKRAEELNSTLNANLTLSNKTAVNDPYSLASLCYSDLLQLRNFEYSKLSEKELLQKKEELLERLNNLERSIDNKQLEDISDLETYLLVKERLKEARQSLQELEDSDNLDSTSTMGLIYNISESNFSKKLLVYTLSFVEERINSANQWSKFFYMDTQKLVLNEETLKTACLEAQGSAHERASYLLIYLPKKYLDSIYESLAEVDMTAANKDYKFCIFQAIKAKAEANVLLTGLFTSNEQLSVYLDKKLNLSSLVINNQIKKGNFPIAGYSYYKYAKTLKERNPYSAMLFTEYAMEMSNLDLYFPKKKSFELSPYFKQYLIIAMIFFSGLLIGISIGLTFRIKQAEKNNRIKKKKRKYSKKTKK